jgi:alpha-tubulin suppressor-like RCC1 family protein
VEGAAPTIGVIAAPSSEPGLLQDLLLEVLTHVCRQLELADLMRISQCCKRFRQGELETAELPAEAPVVAVLCELAFPHLDLAPRTCPVRNSESWVAYLARCVRQRRGREAPRMAAGKMYSLLVDAAGRLRACGHRLALGHGDRQEYFSPTPVASMAGVRVRSVATGDDYSLALSWEGRVYSWGENRFGQLGSGDMLAKPVPALVEGLEGVCGIAASPISSCAVMHSGAVFSWGGFRPPQDEDEDAEVQTRLYRLNLVEGFDGVRVRHVCAGSSVVFAIGEAGELFSWGYGEHWLLGHGYEQSQPSPKRVEALRGVPVSSVAFGCLHMLALSEDGLVYAWGKNRGAALGIPQVKQELTPKPVEALRSVRVGSIAAGYLRSYAVADTGALWSWGDNNSNRSNSLNHAGQTQPPVPEPIESCRDVKMDAVAAGLSHTLALADDGSVYAWGDCDVAYTGALGLGDSSRVQIRRNGRCVRRGAWWRCERAEGTGCTADDVLIGRDRAPCAGGRNSSPPSHPRTNWSMVRDIVSHGGSLYNTVGGRSSVAKRCAEGPGRGTV